MITGPQHITSHHITAKHAIPNLPPILSSHRQTLPIIPDEFIHLFDGIVRSFVSWLID